MMMNSPLHTSISEALGGGPLGNAYPVNNNPVDSLTVKKEESTSHGSGTSIATDEPAEDNSSQPSSDEDDGDEDDVYDDNYDMADYLHRNLFEEGDD